MASAVPSQPWIACIKRSREILQTSKLGVDVLVEECDELNSEVDILKVTESEASDNTASPPPQPGIPVRQFLKCDELTSEDDKLKVAESEASDNTTPPRQHCSDNTAPPELEQEENWDKLPQLWFRASKLRFRKGVPVVPLVQVSCDSIFTDDDPVAKYVKQSVHTNGPLTSERQFGTHENVVNETRGVVGIVTLKRLPVAEELEAIFQMFECLRSNCSSFVLALNYDIYLSTQAEKARVLKDLLEHCRGKTTAEYIRIARELSSSMVFPTPGDSEFLFKHIENLGLQTCKRIAERRSPSSVKDVENMIKEREEKHQNISLSLPDTAKSNLFNLSFVKGYCVIADTPHIYIHEEKFRNRDAHKQVRDIVSSYFGDNYVILEYLDQPSFEPLVSAEPGDAISCYGDPPDSFGTLGALLKVTQESGAEEHDWYALTCSHVVEDCELMKLKREDNTSLVLGKVVYRREKREEKDVALIKVDSSLCPESNGGHIDVRKNMEGICEQKVRKIGAETGETHGIVVGTEFAFPNCAEFGKDSLLLCKELPSVCFAKGGDSGSLVLTEGRREVEALSILVGRVKKPRNLYSPYIPPNEQIFYSDILAVSLNQIKTSFWERFLDGCPRRPSRVIRVSAIGLVEQGAEENQEQDAVPEEIIDE